MMESCLWFPYMKVKYQKVKKFPGCSMAFCVFGSVFHSVENDLASGSVCIHVTKNRTANQIKCWFYLRDGFVLSSYLKVSSASCSSPPRRGSTSCSATAKRHSWQSRKSSCRSRMWACLWSTTAAARRSPSSGSQGGCPVTHTHAHTKLEWQMHVRPHQITARWLFKTLRCAG